MHLVVQSSPQCEILIVEANNTCYCNTISMSSFKYCNTVEPPNNGQVGDKLFCPLFRGCPFFGGRNVWTIYRQGQTVCPL